MSPVQIKHFSRPFSRPLPPSVAKSSHSLLAYCHLYDVPLEWSKKAKHSPTSVPVQATCADTSVPFNRDGATASPLAEAEFLRGKAVRFRELGTFKQEEVEEEEDVSTPHRRQPAVPTGVPTVLHSKDLPVNYSLHSPAEHPSFPCNSQAATSHTTLLRFIRSLL